MIMDLYLLHAGCPSHPQGPLVMFKIYVDHCHLEWQPPKEDGGTQISHYMVQKWDSRDDKWTNVARVCRQPKIQVTGLQLGISYKFMVMAKNSAGFMSEPLESDLVVIKNPTGTCRSDICH